MPPKTIDHPLVVALFSLIVLTSWPLHAQVDVLENGRAPDLHEGTGYFTDSPTRTKIDLSGGWTLSADGQEWQDVAVPSSLDATGRFTFRRRFAVPKGMTSGRAFKFVALGISHDAEVYVNDIYIGRHLGGYTGFQFDIPDDVLQEGTENALQIVVGNEWSARSTVPIRQQSWGWRSYGGILRDIFIVAVPRTWIEEFAPAASVDPGTRQGRVNVRTIFTGALTGTGSPADTVTGRGESFAISLTLTDLQTGVTVAQTPPQVFILEPNKSVELRSTLTLENPRPWRSERPDLYRVRATVSVVEGRQQRVVDQVDRTVGFPLVQVRQGQLYEHDVRLRLRGVTWHEDHPDVGAALSYDQMEKDMALIKSLGANAVRFAFHPPHPYLLDLCSRYGLYAFVEVPVWNVPSAVLAEETFRQLAEQTTRETVEQLRHHPSVLAWGVGGALDPSDHRSARFTTALAAVVRGLDARFVYAAVAFTDEDRITPGMDLAAFVLGSRDVKDFRSGLRSIRTTYPDRPAVVLSFGPQVVHENRNGYRDPSSQESQARFYLQHIAALKESGVAGGFVAALADWKGDRPALTVRTPDRTVYPLGLLNRDREKRLAFDVVRAQYQEEKFSAIPAGNHRSAFPASQVVAGLVLIILFGYQYSYNRRFGESVKRALLRSYNFFADLRDRGDVPAFATVVLAFCIAATMGVVLASLLHHFRSDPMADALATLVLPWDGVKSQVSRAAWNPLLGIGLFSALSFGLLLLVSLLLRVVGLLARARTTWSKAWFVTVWGALPLMALSPVGMSLFKILETPAFVLPVLVIVAVIVAWGAVRVVKGASVVLDISAARAYGLTLFLLAVIAGSAALFYDSRYAAGAFLEHLPTVVGVAG